MSGRIPRLAATVLDSADPFALAAFYQQLFEWPDLVVEEAPPGGPPQDGWLMLRAPDGGVGLSFQYEPNYSPPVWPAGAGDPLMMMHLDVAVADLDAAVDRAVGLGATMAEHQPQEDVRVMLDPDGHPFCLFPDV